MTENKQFVYYEHKGVDYILENPNDDLDFIEMLGDCLDSEEIVNRLNELYEQNQSIKKTINLLYDAIKSDIDDGFEVYPKILVKYIMNTLKVIGDFE